jgi:hypothetical protein
MDLEMLMMPGGRERSAEFRSLFAKSGFGNDRVQRTGYHTGLIRS